MAQKAENRLRIHVVDAMTAWDMLQNHFINEDPFPAGSAVGSGSQL